MTADIHRSPALAPFADTLGALGADETELSAQVSLRVEGVAETELDVATRPNTWSTVGNREALWLGPDEWLVVSEGESAAAVALDLGSRLTGRHASIVDVSAARAVIELGDPTRLDLLGAGCGLDLHARSWRSGMCAQTLLARVPVLLQERDETTRLFVRPSYAGYVVAWLARVAAPG